jgi:hypothetical protein
LVQAVPGTAPGRPPGPAPGQGGFIRHVARAPANARSPANAATEADRLQ